MTKRAAMVLAGLGLLSSLSGCVGVLSPAGPVGEAQKLILYNSMAIMLCIVVPTIIATFVFGWWFRASNKKANYRPEFTYSGRIEFVVWAIPALVIMFLGGITWIGSHELDPYKPLDTGKEALPVEVVSLDWKWLFIYPTLNFATVNKLVIPAGQPVHFKLTSATVMNAFFVPQLGSMIYTMNGMQTQLHLMADEVGEFHGLSSHFSGDGFSDMDFDVDAVSTADFNNFVGKARQGSNPLTDAAYAKLAEESKDVTPYTYSSVQSGLFDAILRRVAPLSTGPTSGQPSVNVSPRSGS